MSKSLLIFICIMLAIAFAVSCADLYHKWQEERTFRIFVQTLASSYEGDIEHYQQLCSWWENKYYDCQNQTNPKAPWETAIVK